MQRFLLVLVAFVLLGDGFYVPEVDQLQVDVGRTPVELGTSEPVLQPGLQIFPLYGYNEESDICQVKQFSATSSRRESLSGEYWDLRACRFDNPEIIFFTGRGIIFWIALFAVIIIRHFYLLPRFRKDKLSLSEKRVSVLWDLGIVFSSLFILVLLTHFFDVPSPSYFYAADIDRIIYSTLIDGRVPGIYFFLYLVWSGLSYFRKSHLTT